MYTIKCKKIHEKAVIPQYAHSEDAGMDLSSVEDKIIKAHEISLIKTGLIIELPQNTEAQIRPRSGLALKSGITVLNSPGTIDQGYRGEIGVILVNHSNHDFHVKVGMRIAQLVICPVYHATMVEAEVNTNELRGSSGFGSTGSGYTSDYELP